MNEHGILFLKQKNVSKTHRRNYAATTRRFSVIFALDFFLMGHPSLSTLAGENEAAPVITGARAEFLSPQLRMEQVYYAGD